MSQQQVPDRSQQYRQSDPGGEAEAFTTQQPPQQQQAPRQQQNQQAPRQQQNQQAPRQQPQSQQQPQQQQQRTGEMAGPVGQRFPSRCYLPESVRTTSIGQTPVEQADTRRPDALREVTPRREPLADGACHFTRALLLLLGLLL